MNRPPNPAELWPHSGTCALCRTEGRLCRSHIIPKFVGDWLRSTNVTGRFRTNRSPNRLVEDLEWRYLLCETCERRFNVFETDVCERIFLPIHDRTQDRFRYGTAFARFCASVAWRALVMQQREGTLGPLNEIPEGVESAERTWREFLLDRLDTPAPHVLHAIPLDVPTNLDTEGRSPHFARFLLRTPTIGTRFRNGAGYVVVKMARLMVVGTIAHGDERRKWRATQIHASGGAWGVERYHLPGWVDGFLNLGASRVQALTEQVSDRQQERTDDVRWAAVRENPDAVAASDLFRAFEADVRLFGSRAFQDFNDNGEED